MGDLLGECGSTTQVSQTQGGAAEASVHQLTSSSNEDGPGSPGSPHFGGAPLKVKTSWHGAREDVRQTRETQALRWEGVSVLKTCTGELRWM